MLLLLTTPLGDAETVVLDGQTLLRFKQAIMSLPKAVRSVSMHKSAVLRPCVDCRDVVREVAQSPACETSWKLVSPLRAWQVAGKAARQNDPGAADVEGRDVEVADVVAGVVEAVVGEPHTIDV